MMPSLLLAAATGAALLLPFVSVRDQSGEEITKENILATGQEWQEKHAHYEPEAEMINALKGKLGADAKIDIYLGLWCPDSLNNVPLFIKIMDRLEAGIPVHYFSLPRKAGSDMKYFVEELKVDRVPTFIFYKGDKEIGRIVENPKAGMLEDFMEIVFK